ncbi:MAG: L-rhamnose isomerase [candidate division KSB1 bacterium]|nr:L-rhamnose isomerase [candidate division KSB1 bacterium]
MSTNWQEAYEWLRKELEARGVDVARVEQKAMSLAVETPSWGYGDSGTRFAVFHQPGVPRTVFEKLEDAAQVHKLTGIAPSVAIHIPWDRVDDFRELKRRAESLGLKIGAVNPNLFQDPDYKFGSITHSDPRVRRKAIDHLLECVEIARQVGSKLLTPWFADGTDYPGQGNFRWRRQWLEEALREVYHAMPEDMTLALEYKFFEPAFYHTDIPDWGTSYLLCTKLGPRAKVLVDLGHHPQGTNVPYIVALLLYEGRLGGFHFNSRKYADDDLTAGSIDPYELFLIFHELVEAEEQDPGRFQVAYMLDQSHITKPKIEAMIQSVITVQEMYTRALLVNREALHAAQQANRVIEAEELLRQAFWTDVGPILAKARVDRGLPADPLRAYRESGYQQRIENERRGGKPASWT